LAVAVANSALPRVREAPSGEQFLNLLRLPFPTAGWSPRLCGALWARALGTGPHPRSVRAPVPVCPRSTAGLSALHSGSVRAPLLVYPRSTSGLSALHCGSVRAPLRVCPRSTAGLSVLHCGFVHTPCGLVSLASAWRCGRTWGLVRSLGGREPHGACQAGGLPWGGRESFSAPLYISWSNFRGTTLPNVLNWYLEAGVISRVPLCPPF